jgi:hypothetical protein
MRTYVKSDKRANRTSFRVARYLFGVAVQVRCLRSGCRGCMRRWTAQNAGIDVAADAGDEPVSTLLLSERLQRIDLNRPARRHVTGEHRHRCQQ